MYSIAFSSIDTTSPVGGPQTYQVADFINRSDFLIATHLTDAETFTMAQAKCLFDHFRGMNFAFEEVVCSIMIHAGHECLPGYSFAAGLLYPESLDSMFVRNKSSEPIGAICFEYGGKAHAPHICVMQLEAFLRLPSRDGGTDIHFAARCSIHGLPNGRDGYCSGCEADQNIRILNCKRCGRNYSLNSSQSHGGLCAHCTQDSLAAMCSY